MSRADREYSLQMLLLLMQYFNFTFDYDGPTTLIDGSI